MATAEKWPKTRRSATQTIDPRLFYCADDDLKDCWNRLNERELTVAEAVEEREELQRKSIPVTKKTNFACGVAVLIIANAVCIGIEADYGTQYAAPFKIAEHIFTTAFVMELGLRWYCEGLTAYFGGAMNWLDCFLVVSAVVDTWLIGATNLDVDLRTMSLLRLLRLTRLVRLFRLFRLFKELSVITTGFIKSQRTLLWASVFLFIIVYTFAVFAKLKIGNSCRNDVDNSPDKYCIQSFNFAEGFPTQVELFGTISRSMLTLFVCFSEGCGMDIIWPMSLAEPWVMMFWHLFVVVTNWGIMNIIVGIFCENIMVAVDSVERELKGPKGVERDKKVMQLKSMFNLLDTDSSGIVSRSEWTDGIQNSKELQEFIVNLGLHDCANIFDTLDINADGELSFPEFFDGITLLLKGTEPVAAKDLVSTFLLVKSASERLAVLDEMVKKMRKDMDVNRNGTSSCSSSKDDMQRCINNSNTYCKKAALENPSELPGKISTLPNLQQDLIVMQSQIGAIMHKVDSGFQAMQGISKRLENLENLFACDDTIQNSCHEPDVLT